MDPHTGKLYGSIEDALTDGVKRPVYISGSKKQATRISNAVQQMHLAEREAALRNALLQRLEAEVKHEKYLKKKAAKKRAKHSRKKNR